MFLQFALVVVLALSGLASHASQVRDSSVPQDRVVGHRVSGANVVTTALTAASGAAASGAAASGASASGASASDARPDGGSLKDLDIVVPPLKPSGAVANPRVPLKTQAASGVVVADQLVTPKRVESQVVSTAGFQTLGMTWPEKAKVGDLGGQVRTRTSGKWSTWVALDPSDNAPDAGTPDAARAVRGGTDPVSIGHADAVQLSFTATAKGGPAGLSLALIGSAERPASDSVVASTALGTTAVGTTALGTTALGTTSGGAAVVQTAISPRAAAVLAALPRPAHHTRAQWGAPAQACTP